MRHAEQCAGGWRKSAGRTLWEGARNLQGLPRLPRDGGRRRPARSPWPGRRGQRREPLPRRWRGDIRRLRQMRGRAAARAIPRRATLAWAAGAIRRQRLVARCAGIPAWLDQQDRQRVSAAERRGVGVRRARRHLDGVRAGRQPFRPSRRISTTRAAGPSRSALYRQCFGLYDVHGNASEWAQDCWNDAVDDRPADRRRGIGRLVLSRDPRRFVGHHIANLRIDARFKAPASGRGRLDGFRVARDLK